MIETRELTKAYRSGSGELKAADGVQLSLQRGDFALIVGRSGSGKSTLLGMLGGMTRPTDGRILFEGKDLWALSDRERAAVRAQRIGFVFQFAGLLPTLTAMENALLPTLFIDRKAEAVDRAEEIFASFGIADKRSSYPSQLSGGELKRVAMVRALVNDPALVLADEPTSDLDVDTEKEIMETFRRINAEGKTVVMVTHNPDLKPYANKIFRMDRGRLAEAEKDSPGSQS